MGNPGSRGENMAPPLERAVALVDRQQERGGGGAGRLINQPARRDGDLRLAVSVLFSASELERVGDYAVAIARIAEQAPDDRSVGAEGRLRLGVNLARVGSKRAAEQRLQECLAPDRPRWVRTVAYQELAVLLTEQGRLEEAARWLEQALQRLPRLLAVVAGDPQRHRQIADAPRRIGDHALLDLRGGARERPSVALRDDPHRRQHARPERGRDQHRDQDENPRRRVPQLTSSLGSLPHAGNCISARFSLRLSGVTSA